MESRIVEEIRRQAETEGYDPESEAYEKRVRQLKVLKCREIRGNDTCTECNFFEHCDLAKQVMRDKRGY